MPKWSQRAESPASSSTCVKNAMTSWRVRSSIAEMRDGSSLPKAALRTAIHAIERALGQRRPIVHLRKVRRDHHFWRGTLLQDHAQQRRRLIIRQMAALSADTPLQRRRIRAVPQERRVVIGLEHE